MASNDVVGLSDRMHVRSRTGMYLGNTENPSIAVREIIDNSIDEILVGRADTIRVWYSSKGRMEDLMSPNTIEWMNNSTDQEVINVLKTIKETKLIRYTICDNGGGIPIKATKDLAGNIITMAEYAMGSLRSGSKFSKTEIMAGMNGLGTSCCNFTSATFSVYSRLITQDKNLTIDSVKELWNDSPRAYYKVTFSTGLKVSEEVVIIDDEKFLPEGLLSLSNDELPSTITTMIADPTIWHSQSCQIPLNTRYLKYMMNEKGTETHFYINDVENTDMPTKYENSFTCRIQNEESGTKNDFMEFYISLGVSENLTEYDRDFSVNTLNTQQGHHVSLFDKSWKAAFSSVFGDCKGYETYGLNVLCIFTCPEPAFSSQTKEKLSDIPGFYLYKEYPELTKAMIKVIRSNMEVFSQNAARIKEYLASMDNWSRLSQIKNMLSVGSDLGGKAGSSAFKPKKLSDAQNPDRSKCELFIVEGNSASGSMKAGRTGTDTIGILPLKGRPLNVSGMDITDVLENDEMYDIINAIGVGVNDYHDTSQIRYGKVIIATDGDSDGFAIAALVLNCIVRHLTFLLDEGYVYVAMSPLYEDRVTHKFYYSGDESLMETECQGHEIQRYKGLGEMNPDALKRAFYDKKERRLVKITKDNLDEALALCSSTHARKHLMLTENVITEDQLTLDKVNTNFTESFNDQ